MEEKKKFLKPEAEIINFSNEDIITDSGEETLGEEEYGNL